MNFSDALKETFKVAKKLNNIELNSKLLAVQQQALEIQKQSRIYEEENEKLKEIIAISQDIERHKGMTIVTLRSDNKRILYCSRCWDKDKNRIQVVERDNGIFECPECSNSGIYSKEKYNRHNQEYTPIQII